LVKKEQSHLCFISFPKPEKRIFWASVITNPKRKTNHFEKDLILSFGKKVFLKIHLNLLCFKIS